MYLRFFYLLTEPLWNMYGKLQSSCLALKLKKCPQQRWRLSLSSTLCGSTQVQQFDVCLLRLFFNFVLLVGQQTSFSSPTVLEFVNVVLISQWKQFSVILWTTSIGLMILPKVIKLCFTANRRNAKVQRLCAYEKWLAENSKLQFM